jgi:hypothetical protein
MKHRVKFSLLAVLLFAECFWSVHCADASVVYTYTGNDFEYVSPPFGPSPFSLTDSITASVTLSSPLGDNLFESPFSPISFTISDGVDKFTSSTSGTSLFLIFDTGPTGTITGWDFTVMGPGGPDGLMIETSYLPELDYSNDGAFFTATDVFANVSGDPGSWTPLPDTLPLFATGVGAMGLLGWRRKRKNVAAIAAA